MINSKDISVVVQGAVDKNLTPKCLKSIRKFLPDAEIILSTWEDSNVEGLSYDVLVLNKDPGNFRHDYAIYNLPRSKNNFNRQLVSIKGGLSKVSRKYCLKLRSDLVLDNANFLRYWDKFQVREDKYKIFKHRVFGSSIYAREYSCQSGTGLPTPFHPSDFWFFGLSEDIKNYFEDCPLQTKEEGSFWTFKHPTRCPYLSPLWRYAPEQFFCLNWVKKYYSNIKFDDWSDWSPENIELSNNILYNNFVMLGMEQSGIFSNKHIYAEHIKQYIQGLITYEHFQEQYKKYCDADYIIPKGSKSYEKKLQTHFARVSEPFKTFVRNIKGINKWFSEIFSVLYYSIMYLISFFTGSSEKND